MSPLNPLRSSDERWPHPNLAKLEEDLLILLDLDYLLSPEALNRLSDIQCLAA